MKKWKSSIPMLLGVLMLLAVAVAVPQKAYAVRAAEQQVCPGGGHYLDIYACSYDYDSDQKHQVMHVCNNRNCDYYQQYFYWSELEDCVYVRGYTLFRREPFNSTQHVELYSGACQYCFKESYSVTVKYYEDHYYYGSTKTGYESVDNTYHKPYEVQICSDCSYEKKTYKSKEKHNLEETFNSILLDKEQKHNSTTHWYVAEYECKDCEIVVTGKVDEEKHNLVGGKYRYTYLSDNQHQVERYYSCDGCSYSVWKKTKVADCTQENLKTTYTSVDSKSHTVTKKCDVNCTKCGHTKTGLLLSKITEDHVFTAQTTAKKTSAGHWYEVKYSCKHCGYTKPTTFKTAVSTHTFVKTGSPTYTKTDSTTTHSVSQKYKCSCCGYTKTVKTSQKHLTKSNASYTQTFNKYYDSTYHNRFKYYYCVCDYIIDADSTKYSHSYRWTGSTAVGGKMSYQCSGCSHVLATESSLAKNVTIYRDENTKTINFPTTKYDSVASIHITYGESLSITKQGSSSFTVKVLERGDYADTEVTVKMMSGVTYQYFFSIPGSSG